MSLQLSPESSAESSAGSNHPSVREGHHPGASASGEVTRRAVLRAGVAGLGAAATLQPMARAAASLHARPPAAEPFLVVVDLQGGNDGLNTVVPLAVSRYADRRPGLALTAGDCLSMNSGPNATVAWGLHPSLAELGALWSEGALGVVRKVGYPRPNFSHFSSGDIWSYGVRDSVSLGAGTSGWIARYADRNTSSSLGVVSVGMGRPRSFIGGATNPLLVGNLSSFQFLDDSSYRNNHRLRLEIVRGMLAADSRGGVAARNRAALEQGHALADRIQAAVSGYTSSVTYGSQAISRRLRDVATLLQAGFETRIFYTGFGGFDTHGAQGKTTGRHADLLRSLDEGLGSFVKDLKNMGLWESAVIVVMSEFGRRNFENGSGGTDHGGANHVLVLGGGVNGGLHGPEISDPDLDDKNLVYEIDFRSIYKEILSSHLGATDIAGIFPEAQEQDAPLGLL